MPISINKEGVTDEEPRKVPQEKNEKEPKSEQKTIRRAAQRPATNHPRCSAGAGHPQRPKPTPPALFLSEALSSRTRAGQKFLRSSPSRSPSLPTGGEISVP